MYVQQVAVYFIFYILLEVSVEMTDLNVKAEMLTVEFEYIQTTWKRSTASIMLHIKSVMHQPRVYLYKNCNHSSSRTHTRVHMSYIRNGSWYIKDQIRPVTFRSDRMTRPDLSNLSPIETDRLADGVRQGEPRAWWKRGDNVFSIRSPAEEALHQGDLIRPFPNNPIDQSHYSDLC